MSTLWVKNSWVGIINIVLYLGRWWSTETFDNLYRITWLVKVGFGPRNQCAQQLCSSLLTLTWNFLGSHVKVTARWQLNQHVGISKNEVLTSLKHFVPHWCQVGLEKEEAKPEIWQQLGLMLKACFCSYSTISVFSPALIPFLLFTCKQNHCSPFFGVGY